MTVKLIILLALTVLLVGGLLTFCSGSEPRSIVDQQPVTRMNTKADREFITNNTVATPFGTLPNQVQNPPSTSEAMGSNIIALNEPTERSAPQADVEPSPLQLIDAYMTAWSGKNRSEIQAIWQQIGRCPECLQRIRELLMNQSIPQGMLLELTHQIIELGDESMLPVFDYLLQPSVDLNTRIIVTRQMLKDGRSMYVRKLFGVLQQADLDGHHDYAARQTWMISKLHNPQGVEALFDVMSGRSGAAPAFAAHVRTVFNKTLLGVEYEGLGEAMAGYYQSSNTTEQENLWEVISLHSQSLLQLSINAYQNGDNGQFRTYSRAMAAVNSVAAIEHTLQLASAIDYSQEYFNDMVRSSTRRFNNMEVFHKLEDYLRNPSADRRSRIVAAEGLLAVKEMEEARYILEKALNSNSYEDAEIVAYISGRL